MPYINTNGICLNVPMAIAKHRAKFKQIGRNIFVITGGSAATIKMLKSDKQLLSTLLATLGNKATLGQAVSSIAASGSRRATPDEVQEYKLGKSEFDKFIAAHLAEQAKRRQRRIDSECNRSLAFLKRHGRIPDVADTATMETPV